MNIDYADLLSGDVIFIKNIGHFRSPYLRELKPTSGIGNGCYNLYLNLIAWDKDSLLKYARIMMLPGLKAFDKHENLNVFDIYTLIPQLRESLKEAISFFMPDDIEWDEKLKCFNVFCQQKLIGNINRDNYSDVSKTILKLNYVGLDDSEENEKPRFASEKARIRWEKAQEFLKEQAKTQKKEKPEYSLGNIISKLCSIHNSYNLLNIYELTVFQLYDQFFQCLYLHTIELNERIFTTHGGDNFDSGEWLKPINKNKGDI